MTNIKRLALAALAGFGLSALGAVTDTTLWAVDFESPTSNNVEFVEGQLGNLTNSVAYSGAAGLQPYDEGVWYAVDGDESYITNGIVTNVVAGVNVETNSAYLKLDTQGNDLRWEPEDSVAGKLTLVDADILLVGSDSPPDATDFDAGGDVQTAVYLRNYPDDETGVVTNSLLCVYVYNGTTGKSYWQELDGTTIDDNSWHHVRVLVDYSGESFASVQVFVDDMDTPMHANGDPSATSWTVANRGNNYTHLSSVSFRGTGAVDNFVGKTRELTFPTLTFEAEVFIDGVKQAEGIVGNTTRYVDAEAGDPGSGKTVTFQGFLYHDFDLEVGEPPTYCLRTIEFTDFVGNTTKTLNYGYSGIEDGMQPLPETETNAVEFVTMEDPESGEDIFYGPFHVTAITDGATDPTNLAVQIYFKTIGAYDAIATTTADGTTTTNAVTVKPADIPLATNWTFNAVQGGNILSNIVVSGGATLAYDAGVATVSISLNEALAADTVFAAATYVPGTLAEGQDLRYTVDGGVYTFAPYTPPVALRITNDGATTNEYASLRAAIEAASAGETVYLVADDRVSFSATATEIGITKALTIDGGSNTLYGVTDYAYDGVNDHDIYIGGSGDVTIKDLKISEFSDTAPTVQMQSYPIWTGEAYSGKLTLDGVQIDKFARTAINLSGGTFEITNCVIKGYADAETVPATFYQDAIFVYKAKGTVAETTVTGVGEANTGYGAAVFTVRTSGTGEITVLSGSYTGLYVAAVNTNATGSITIEGGTFVATNTAGEGEDPDSAFEPANTVGKIVVKGGWFDREPDAEYLAVPYVAVEDAANAPNPAATWTVKAAAVQIEGDATKSYLSIADAAAYAETNSIADPVFVVVAPLSPETVTLTNAADALTVKTTNNVYLADLGVVTSLESTDAVEYTVVTQTVVNTEVDPPVLTVVYAVSAQNYVAKIVDGATTNKYATFTAAATVAMAQTPTLVVEMVANTNAEENAFAITGSLKVKAGAFLIPELTAEDRSHYLVASEPDGNGVVTYTSTAYLTATFLNGDGSELDKDEFVEVGGVPRYNIAPTDVTPYPPAQPGYWVVFMNQWSPAFGPITEDTVFRPTFKTNVIEYSIQYVTNGIGNKYAGLDPHWPEGYAPPESYYVTNDTIVIESPVMDGWVFQGWYTNVTEGVPVGDLVNPGVIPTGSYDPKFFYAEFAQLLDVQFTTNGVVYTNFSAVAGTTFAKPADPAVPTLEGYDFSFDGWSTNGLASGLIADADWPQTVVRNDQTYAAMFSSNATEYAITVALNGGEWGAIYTPPATYTVESPEISIPDPVQDGYEFAGWTNAAGTVVSAVIPTGSTGAQSFGATWTKLWTVTFKNGDATIYETNYLDGATAEYVGETPTKAATAQYTFTFAGWDPALGAVTADTVYAATFSSNAVEYAISFWTNEVDVGTAYFATNAAYGATGYGPADPEKSGFTFAGWTNTVAGGAVVADAANLPAVEAAAKWLAVWTASEIHVNPGDGLAQYKEDHPTADVPEPIEFTDDATPKCEVAFVAPATGTYVLLSSTTLTTDPATWNQDPNSQAVQAQAGEIVQLEEGTPGTVKFFAIGYQE